MLWAKKSKTFKESSFLLCFQTDDPVIRYDEHPFYRQFTSAGLKAVDFVFMEKDQLVLLELKNYGQYAPKALYPPADELAYTLVEKMRGSSTGLAAIFAYFRTRNPKRLLFKFLDRMPFFIQRQHPWYIKAKAFEADRWFFLLVIGFPKGESSEVKQDYCDLLTKTWQSLSEVPLQIIVEDSQETLEALDLKIL